MIRAGVRKGQGLDKGTEWKGVLLWVRIGGKKRGIILGLYIELQKPSSLSL